MKINKKTNKLNILLIAACCFVISLCSGSQGMDTQLLREENSTHNNIPYEQSCFQNEDNALDLGSIPSLVIKQEDPSVSWVSYLLSPAKAVIQSTYEVMNYANKYPKQAVFFGLYIACQAAMAAPIACTYIYESGYTIVANYTMGDCDSCGPVIDKWCRDRDWCVERGSYYYTCTEATFRKL
jgi:hypothetical protein